jgi:hypothetical protein
MAVNLREALIARVTALKRQRTEKVANTQREIDALTAQITAAESLAGQWNTIRPSRCSTRPGSGWRLSDTDARHQSQPLHQHQDQAAQEG